MAGDGKAVGFVTDLLQQVQAGVVVVKGLLAAVGVDKRFKTGLAGGAFGYAEHGHIKPQFRNYFHGLAELAFAAVYYQQVRQGLSSACWRL